MNMNYEKPAMKFVSMQSKENVAGVCWSDAANTPGKKWYYDYNEGELGYLQFTLEANCSGAPNSILSMDYMPEEVGKTPEAEAAEARIRKDLKDVIKFQFTGYGITDDPSEVS